MKIVDGLPSFLDCAGSLTLRVCARSAVVQCDRFIARFSLSTGKMDWVVERTPVRLAETMKLPRFIGLFSANSVLWFSEQVVAEIISIGCGGARILARDALTGIQLWEHFIAIPDAVDWAEVTPAWSGAQIEEIYGFIADDAERLVVLLTRHTRRTRIYSPAVTVNTMPPFRCQTEAVRFEPSTGELMWRATFQDVHVGIIARNSFSGIWARSPRLGVIDFETGTNTILHELPHSLGWPVYDGTEIAVPWYSKNEVGVEWIDVKGRHVRSGNWRHPRATRTKLHLTCAGMALQTSEQGLWWLGKECVPLWNVRAKPYIYRVHRMSDTDVFVGTDGNGGRLLAFDAESGRETLNLKPVLGGVGDLAKIPGQTILVSTFRTSRSYSAPTHLLVLSMMDRRHALDQECFHLLGTWEDGVVCRTGRDGDRIAVINLRSPETATV
ncbi:MAG TPA: hypothetical protein VGY55_20615 [Pirellulales bacterium]|jgi:hypothetical protein|nr:hypothetical protein [Pirellulales bacterium]